MTEQTQPDFFDDTGEAYGWIGTYSGGRISPFNPRAEDIKMIDIVAALPHVNRFGGHSIWPYSVSTHSCMLYEYGKQAVKSDLEGLGWALLHDAAEAYIGDIPRPIKHAIPQFVEIDNNLTRIIANKYGLEGGCPDWVKYADRNIVRREAMELFPSPPDWVEAYDDIGTDVPRWDVDQSRAQFLVRLKALFGDNVLER